MIKNELGRRVHEHLTTLSIETPFEPGEIVRRFEIADCMHRIMENLGLKMNDDSLQQTPERVAKMYCDEVFYGLDYERFPKCTTFENKMTYDEMIVTDCTVMSLCEHHFVPFIGNAFVGYIPRHKVLGLSKFNRVVDFFSRRPQVQERLTVQIYAALCYILDTDDVAVVMKAEHLCSKLRGVKDARASTSTSKLGGRFMSKPELRAEFLALTRR